MRMMNLLRAMEKNNQFHSEPKIVMYFVCTNIIFGECNDKNEWKNLLDM